LVRTLVDSIVPMQTLTLAVAAAFLEMHPEEVRSRAKRGALPACKPGRRWVFVDEDVAAFLRESCSVPVADKNNKPRYMPVVAGECW
jgi:Helix-turn-helix domain